MFEVWKLGSNACDTKRRSVWCKCIVLSTRGHKCQLMDDVKGMIYTEWMRGKERGER